MKRDVYEERCYYNITIDVTIVVQMNPGDELRRYRCIH